MQSSVTVRDVRIDGVVVAHMRYDGAQCVEVRHCDPCPHNGAIPDLPDVHTHMSYGIVPGCPVCDLLVTDAMVYGIGGSDADRPYSAQAR
jgi:hypothetical protein